MTQLPDELRTEEKVVVVFDICSSTSMLEDLLLSGNLKAWRNLHIQVKDFLHREASQSAMEAYKFIGDGWILLFPSSVSGDYLVEFLETLSSFYQAKIEELVAPRLQNMPTNMGLTFGVDAGPLVHMTMHENSEFIGRALNVAARLQSSLKEDDPRPGYKVLFSRPAFTSLGVDATKGEVKSRNLRNIKSGETLTCLKLRLSMAERGETSSLARSHAVVARTRPAPPGDNWKGYQLAPSLNKAELRRLIDGFRGAAKRSIDVSLAEKLEAQLLECDPPRLQKNAIVQLAKWCDTNNPLYADGMEVARRMSLLMFGEVIDRKRFNA